MNKTTLRTLLLASSLLSYGVNAQEVMPPGGPYQSSQVSGQNESVNMTAEAIAQNAHQPQSSHMNQSEMRPMQPPEWVIKSQQEMDELRKQQQLAYQQAWNQHQQQMQQYMQNRPVNRAMTEQDQSSAWVRPGMSQQPSYFNYRPGVQHHNRPVPNNMFPPARRTGPAQQEDMDLNKQQADQRRMYGYFPPVPYSYPSAQPRYWR